MSRFDTLPEPVRLEDTITSQDVEHAEPDTGQVVDTWLLRTAGG